MLIRILWHFIVVRCQSESETEVEGADEGGELGIVGDDVQDYSGGSFSPAPGVKTVSVFPKNPSKRKYTTSYW